LGRLVNGEELVQAVSGQPLSAQPFLTYLRAKMHALTEGGR
jgi:carboxypeptidase Taq